MFGKSRIYLDLAAGLLGNPSSPHAEGRAAKKILEDSRNAIARLTETKPDDIVFTSGATEANNIAIRGLAKPGAHFLYLPSAHASVVETMRAVAKLGVEVEPLIIKDGKVDIEKLKTQLKPETVLVSMDAVCGETGAIWNTREVANVLSVAAPSARSAQAARPIQHLANGSPTSRVLLHIDASQAVHSEKLNRAHFSADLLTFDGAKLGVPGTGCLIAHRTIELASVMTGGGQERGLRPGTENVAAIKEFAANLGTATASREEFIKRTTSARETLLPELESIADLYINVGAKHVPHILNVSLIGRDTDYIVALLDEAGFAVSTRSACETDSEEGSRAVMALCGEVARAKATLRISWGSETRPKDLQRFAAALSSAIHFVDTARER